MMATARPLSIATKTALGIYGFMVPLAATLKAMQASANDVEVNRVVDEMNELERTSLRPLDTQILEKTAEGTGEGARKLFSEQYRPALERYTALVHRLGTIAGSKAQLAEKSALATNRRVSTATTIVLAIGLVAVGVAARIVLSRVRRRLQRTVDQLRQVAAGTLVKEPPDPGATAQESAASAASLDAAVQTLRGLLAEMQLAPQTGADQPRHLSLSI